MATTTGPDLSFARQQVEALMDDTCVITRDHQGGRDDVLNQDTGELVTKPNDEAVVYDETSIGDGGRELGARCKVSPMSADSAARNVSEGGNPLRTRYYRGSIPWDAPMPAKGDELRLTSSRRDPELVGQLFYVEDVLTSTFLVSRRLVLERR